MRDFVSFWQRFAFSKWCFERSESKLCASECYWLLLSSTFNCSVGMKLTTEFLVVSNCWADKMWSMHDVHRKSERDRKNSLQCQSNIHYQLSVFTFRLIFLSHVPIYFENRWQAKMIHIKCSDHRSMNESGREVSEKQIRIYRKAEQNIRRTEMRQYRLTQVIFLWNANFYILFWFGVSFCMLAHMWTFSIL